MKALLLSAGLGTRLRPLTETIPKCLVPIRGKPLLEIWLERLSAVGIQEFLVNTHYLNNQMENFIAASKYKDRVTLVHEKKLLGTSGTLVANVDFFQGEDGMLIHADNYCLADLKEFQNAHNKRPRECAMTMMTFRTEEPTACGIVEVNSRNIVTDFHEKISNPPGNLANAAVYILSAELIKKMATDLRRMTDFSIEVLQELKGSIYSYETSNTLIDIGTVNNYEKANKLKS
jgi:mannose-1-phosphate guanylyltransferase